MYKRLPVLVLSLVACTSLHATNGPYDFSSNWPTHYVFADGTDLGVSVKYQYDVDRFSSDRGAFEDSQTNRRKEFGVFVRKKDVYEATAVFDFQARTWLDVYARVQTRPWLGADYGSLRVGYDKTFVGFEGVTGTGSTTFMETALPVQAIYAGRRIGVDWALLRPHFVLNVGYYSGGDLQGDADGRMWAARAAWVPLNAAGNVLHLGVSASREEPEGTTDGRGVYHPPSARLRARPEAGLLNQRLIDSGALTPTTHVDRRGFESLWIRGPWSVQGEYLSAKVKLDDGRPAYHAQGFYVFGSWVLTGESRGYSGGNVADLKPKGAYGAVELAIRYSQLDLDDGPILGGTERDWTFGINWYINRYLKLQGNYVHANSDRRGVRIDPNVVQVRAQIMF
ncbi:phosphate-selective porin OprO/OprP [Luteibacter sp. Sphag1AF]|uniref:OprO/OprP family phosphate-selective porin n=1 Tax=Luteibacter sp. Sphag1AF TaxID=2587031 RepID=UPI00160EEBE6|nr:porin [Luteibacter sp. Sphag1AF]MBB3226537.1 phosphate-selective porin OprO/OprP [Luteibacter sp. Sphag1AF]